MSNIVQPESLCEPMLEAYKTILAGQLRKEIEKYMQPIIDKAVEDAMDEMKHRVNAYRDIAYDQIMVILETSIKRVEGTK